MYLNVCSSKKYPDSAKKIITLKDIISMKIEEINEEEKMYMYNAIKNEIKNKGS